MTPASNEQAQLAIARARQALRQKQPVEAQRWARLATQVDPGMEEPWLILAAFAQPRESLEYVQRALAINPTNQHAQQALVWALGRQDASNPSTASPLPGEDTARVRISAPESLQDTARIPAAPRPLPVTPPGTQPAKKPAAPARRSRRRISGWGWTAISLALLVSVCIGILLIAPLLVPLAGVVLAQVSPVSRSMEALGKPSLTPSRTITALVPSATLSGGDIPVASQTAARPATLSPAVVLPTATPIPTKTAAPSKTATATKTRKPTRTATTTKTARPVGPGGVPIVEPTFIATLAPQPARSYSPPSSQPYEPPAPPSGAGEERWIDVNLSSQTAAAYEGDNLVQSFVVSTGTSLHPTVTGQFRIYVKYRYADMKGPGYNLPDVPYVMYFYSGYGLHGTYWHNNFGVPMSHGCVNFSIPDAAWLFDFASVGTLVNVHY